jgi:hypothetical protein
VEDRLGERVERLLGGAVVRTRAAPRGYTPAERWLVELDDGRTAFAKAAVNEMTAGWLRSEHRIYATLDDDFLPALLGWDDDGGLPILVLEDLSADHWPPPWRASDVEAVRATLDRLHATQPPPDVPTLTELFAADGWATVAGDRAPFLSTRLAGETWLGRALPRLLAAEAAFPLDGEALLHLDVRSDNLCLRGDRAILVDWNHACRGNPELDLAFWLPSLELEGGPPPESMVPGVPNAAAVVSGYFAARAGLPPVPNAPGVRPIQLAQLGPALAWVSRALGLDRPDVA